MSQKDSYTKEELYYLFVTDLERYLEVTGDREHPGCSLCVDIMARLRGGC